MLQPARPQRIPTSSLRIQYSNYAWDLDRPIVGSITNNTLRTNSNRCHGWRPQQWPQTHMAGLRYLFSHDSHFSRHRTVSGPWKAAHDQHVLDGGQKTPSFPGGNVAHCVNCVCGYTAGQRLGTPLFWNQFHILHHREDIFVHRDRMCDRTLTLPLKLTSINDVSGFPFPAWRNLYPSLSNAPNNVTIEFAGVNM